MNKKIPLGYIELKTGLKEINAMDDLFLNYMFKNKETWETLRQIVNIFLNEYIHLHSDKKPLPNLIEGDIEVTTQYEYLLDTNNTTKIQDIRLDHAEITYIEFQNRASTIPPISTRAIEYFSLGISHSKGKIANQIWLLAEDVKELLHDEVFTNYLLKDNVTGNSYPNNSSIIFVSLQKLAKNNNIVGELSKFLLGKQVEPTFTEVKSIVKNFDSLFNDFKEDKGVKTVITVKERFKNEGVVEGMEIKSISIAKNAMSLGLPLEQVSLFTGIDIKILKRLKEELEMSNAD